MSLIVFKTKEPTFLEPPAYVPSGTATITQEGTHNIKSYEFVKVNIPQGVKDVFVGGPAASYTYALKKDNTLWACGYGGSGEQSNNSTNNVYTFTQRLTDVKDVICSSSSDGSGEVWALKTDGTLWGCGINTHGQQSSGDTNNVYIFTQRLTNVKSICNTMRDTGVIWAIKNDNTLWGCGWGNNGQQGSGNAGDTHTFTQRLTNVKSVYCSRSTTWAITNDNVLWGCGYGYYGQQGNGKTGITASVQTFTQKLDNAKKVLCGAENTIVLKNDGTVWGCGSNSNSCLGITGSKIKNFTQLIDGVKDLFGSETTTWVLKEDDSIWGCGLGTSGQQGSGNTSNSTTYVQRMTDVKDVACSHNSTWILKKDGTLWGCGRGQEGQQGSGELSNVLVFTQRLTNVEKVTCGGNNNLHPACWAVKKDGTLWGCGANTFGNQGSGDTNTVTVFTQRKF